MTIWTYKRKILGKMEVFDFCEQSDLHRAFFWLLNAMGARSMESVDPDKVDNVDNVNNLTNGEVQRLDELLMTINKVTGRCHT